MNPEQWKIWEGVANSDLLEATNVVIHACFAGRMPLTHFLLPENIKTPMIFCFQGV